ncbi:MAG TPA: glycosyltransferase [Myxococcaceae bacterium]
MKIILSVFGTRGDVYPLGALGQALRARGHAVRVCAPEAYRAWAAGAGLDFAPVGGDVAALLESSEVGVVRMARALVADLPRHFQPLLEAARGADLILGGGLPVAAPSVAEALGAAYRFAGYCPLAFPSRHHPPPHLFKLRRLRALTGAMWRATEQTYGLAGRGAINRFRKTHGLQPVRRVWAHVIGERPLLAADPALAHLPPDLEQRVVQVGSWAAPPANASALPEELEQFLQEGEPPVYLGFGSMPVPDARRLFEVAADAATATDCRLVLSMPAAARAQVPERDGVLVVSEAPHAALFPRMRAVVHHGGAGTTATAARAGVPQVVVPHMLDQHYWASRVTELGLGPRPIPRRALSGKRLAEALAFATRPPVRRRAAGFASELRDDGVQRALEHLHA